MNSIYQGNLHWTNDTSLPDCVLFCSKSRLSSIVHICEYSITCLVFDDENIYNVVCPHLKAHFVANLLLSFYRFLHPALIPAHALGVYSVREGHQGNPYCYQDRVAANAFLNITINNSSRMFLACIFTIKVKQQGVSY